MRKQIPVVLVAGFLGAGKTTLLNHLLHNSSGARIGVVVNDFGSIGVDAMAVAGQVDSMVSLNNGCLCCAVDASGLDGMLARLSGADLDVIVIEASGLAEPRGLIRLLLASEHEHIEYGGLVEVVDGAEFTAVRAEHPELADHVRLADLVVLNKIDRIADGVRETVEELAQGVPVLGVEHGRIDPALLFELPERREEHARQLSFLDLSEEDTADEDHSRHAHARYDSVEFESETPLHPRRFMEFMENRPAGIYRIKGDVDLGLPGHDKKYTVHTVGAFLRLRRSGWAAGERRGTRLVLIGAGIDGETIGKQLRSCEEPDPSQVDSQAMLPVLRFLPEE
ncbi:CobW family GTP-binding protein [Amycolatopsis albispora]|uniref:Cobalamin biosynthesis protein n=1 Tax=Amycolatopsis albispora TaxID=1804986 RepID=A0A344LH41_9PSEU|nr:cobalamin biosynthesis protein [Amycolatopsis albispora]